MRPLSPIGATTGREVTDGPVGGDARADRSDGVDRAISVINLYSAGQSWDATDKAFVPARFRGGGGVLPWAPAPGTALGLCPATRADMYSAMAGVYTTIARACYYGTDGTMGVIDAAIKEYIYYINEEDVLCFYWQVYLSGFSPRDIPHGEGIPREPKS